MELRGHLLIAKAVAAAPNTQTKQLLNPWSPVYTCTSKKSMHKRLVVELLNSGIDVDWEAVRKYCTREIFVLAVK